MVKRQRCVNLGWNSLWSRTRSNVYIDATGTTASLLNLAWNCWWG